MSSATCAELNRQEVGEFWSKVRELLSLQPEDWDYVRVELWDAGRVLAYPASSRTPFRIDKVVCELFVETFASREAHADSLSDKEAEPLLIQIEKDAVDALVSGAEPAGDVWPVEIRFFSADDPECIRRLVWKA